MSAWDDPSYRLLCSLLAGQGADQDWASLREADWLQFAELAEQEGVAPLVDWIFRRGSIPFALPDPIAKRFNRAYYISAARNALILGESEQLQRAFAQAQEPLIVLKGAALAGQLYPDPALRPMSDLDLLVSKVRIPAALKLMEGCGYSLQKATHHFLFSAGRQSQVSVEMHWSLPGIAASIEQVWERAQALDANHSGLALHPEDNLCYLAAHLALQHPGVNSRLIWFYDLHLLLESYAGQLPVDILLEASPTLHSTLQGVQRRFNTSVLNHLSQPGRGAAQAPARGKFSSRWIIASWSALGWKMRIATVLGLVFPSPAYMRWRYQPMPAWLLPACYPIRWWSLFREAAGLLIDGK